MRQLRLLEQAIASRGNTGRSTFWELLIFSCSFEDFFFLIKDNSISYFMESNSEREFVSSVLSYPTTCYAAPFSYLILWDSFFPQYNAKRMRWDLFYSDHMLIGDIVFPFYYENNITITFKTFNVFFFRIRRLNIVNGSKNGIKWIVQNYGSR